MIEIKKIHKRDIPELLDNEDFWNHSFLATSKHRLLAHFKNPHLEDGDLVLLLAYKQGELLGYMGLFIDQITINNKIEKIGWLSTWWVDPKTKGTGIGRDLLNTMYAENHGKIGISQFTPSAKRVYDKSGYFTTLKTNRGIKAVLRSNLSFVMPQLLPESSKLAGLLNNADHFLNFFINIKLWIQSSSITNRLKDIELTYLNSLDQETLLLIKQYNTKDLSDKGSAFFEWLKAYNWVQKAPLLALTNHRKYAFSIYDKAFEFSLIKVNKNNRCIGFIVLQKRNYVTKVLFTYYDANLHSKEIADIIKLQAVKQNTREIICYDDALCANFNKSNLFLYKTTKVKHSIISKAFDKIDFADIKMHFGDGDCSFA
ncbi:GNAT family N-acetyltransferase [Flavobacterium sp. HSC-61S13]|uniref:GNAT family N-acetyltransferase n=1 Tax=Flavobacterium sp. HSC-61S13 TaxID=2910963 RepID=UPI0020A159CF|nr:GNAT family N-acetyltransferase [Flavobacterium sp. HSC-61S13]MCP1994571.1 GNAT superfamily N-acetyltransferase [Flavobacterium sp. HSC-61S13]